VRSSPERTGAAGAGVGQADELAPEALHESPNIASCSPAGIDRGHRYDERGYGAFPEAFPLCYAPQNAGRAMDEG